MNERDSVVIGIALQCALAFPAHDVPRGAAMRFSSSFCGLPLPPVPHAGGGHSLTLMHNHFFDKLVEHGSCQFREISIAFHKLDKLVCFLKVTKYPLNMRLPGSILLHHAQDKPALRRRLRGIWKSD